MESGRIECLASRRILSSDRIQIGSRPEKTGSKGNPIIARVSYSRREFPSLLPCLEAQEVRLPLFHVRVERYITRLKKQPVENNRTKLF